MKAALKYFENIQDPRSIRNQKHPLMTLIGTTLLASLAGIDSFSGFADFTDIEWLQKEHEWPGLKSIGMVATTIHKAGKVMQEQRFYISSLPADAGRLNQAARLHWGIENQLHWRLDVVFNEDGACIRNDNAAENIDILRKWALNVL
jgi:predicted transposase YbfD/YdcC